MLAAPEAYWIHDPAMFFIDAISPKRLRAVLALGALAGLGACANVDLPEPIFADGPMPAEGAQPGADPQAVLTGQRPVRRIEETKAEYPHLSTVPPRPTDLPNPMDRQREMDALAADRAAAGQQAEALRQAAPAPVNPKPGMPAVPEGPPPVPREIAPRS